MIDTLLAGGYTLGSAEKMVQPSGTLCSALINAQAIEIVGGAWTVCDIGLAGSWTLQLGQKKDV
jgi:hypothetical protein